MKSKFSRIKDLFKEDIYYLSGLLPNEIQKKIEDRFSWYDRKKAIYKSSLLEIIGGMTGFMFGYYFYSERNPIVYGGSFLISLEGLVRFALNTQSRFSWKEVRYLNRYDKVKADVSECVAVKEDGYYSIDVYDNELKIGNFILDAKRDIYYRLFVDDDYDDIGIKKLTPHLTQLYKDNIFGSLVFGVPYHCFSSVYKGIKNMINKRKINFKNLEELIKKESIEKN